MSNNRPTIGFFTCHLDNDYAFEVCKGVEYAAREADVNLVIFPGMYMNASYNDPANAKYDYQYNSIYQYASQKTLDALIVSIGSIGSFISMDDMKSFLASFDIPILTIEIEVPGYPALYTEAGTGLKKCIEHLIEDHHVTKIGFVGGRNDNADARERLDVYKSVLESYKIPVLEKRIVEGDFSEFSEPKVETLLDNNPDLEAIVFANDQMTIGGYNVLLKRGYRIGKDILVTGFDNSITSLIQDPQLTTVDNNIIDLGYNAIYKMIDILHGKNKKKTIMQSDLIRRCSCGCNAQSISNKFHKLKQSIVNSDITSYIENFKDLYLSYYTKSFYASQLFKYIDPILEKFAIVIFENSLYDNDSELFDLVDKLFEADIFNYFSSEKLADIISLYSNYSLSMDLDPELRSKLSDMFARLSNHITLSLSRKLYVAERDYKANVWVSVYSIRDTLLCGQNEKACFRLLIDKFTKIGFKSSFLYLYDNPPMLLPDGSWQLPDNVYLQACYVNEKIEVLTGLDRILPSSMLFRNNYTPNDRRHTLVITPLFTNEVQHGLFICEADISVFKHIYSSSIQLGMSLKFLSLTKQQLAIQKRLESSMLEINTKNDLLNHLSITDELTKLYNRRGFFEMAQSASTEKSNAGKTAMVTFVDMDNLKQVNDKFGHKDGDFALKQISETLKKSFPDNSIIARLGGDEFACFFIVNDEESSCDDITERIRTTLEENQKAVNETCDKPYYIDISIGSTTFKCSSTSNIEDVLILADELLYVDKRYKRKSVLKN